MFSILYVDDEPGLLEVGKLFLEQSGQFSVETIESAPRALTLLRARHYDAIISDYQMPVMDGIEFLKRVRASGNTIPFIIFTGRGREEIVIQALNEGADFYLQKGGEPLSQFAELAHKIRQAVQQRMAEASIRDHERRESDIINFLPDATFAIDTQGMVIAWNRAMEKMTGVASSEILGKGDYAYAIPFYHESRPILIDLVLTNDPDTVARYPYIKQEGKTLFSEITIPHFNNGRGAALWFTASPLVDRQGTVVGAIESIREITDWKRAEEALNESERRFRELSDLLPQVVYEIDIDGNLKYANHIAFEIFGYTEDEFRQGLNVMQMIAPDDRERAATGIHAIHDGIGRTGRDTAEYQALRKDGTTFPVTIYSSPVIVNNRITGLRGIIVDITERKRAEDTIRESEQKYRTVFETTGTATVMIENNGTISLANSEFERLSGFPKAEIENRKRWTEFVVQEDLDRMLAQHQLRRQDPASALEHYEFRFRTRSGEVQDIYLSIDIIPGTTKSVASLLDITERKRAEEALSRSGARLRRAELVAGLGHWEFSLETGEAFVSEGARSIYGLADRPWSIREVQQVPLPEYRPILDDALRALISDNRPYDLEFGISRPDDGKFATVHSVAEYDPAKRVVFGIIQDITGRKQAENAIRESEQRYRNVVEDQTEFISRFLPDGTHVFVNEAYCRYFGLKRDEILGHRFRPQIPAEDRERVRSFFASLTPGHPVDIVVHRIIMPDGKVRWQRWSDRAIFDPDEKLREYQSVGRDITETKEAEFALQASEERYRLIADNTADHIWIFDMDLNLKYTSPSVTKIKGFTVEEVLSQSLEQMMTPASVESVLRRFREEMALEATGTADPGRTISFETEEYIKDGSTIMVENVVTLMRDPEGRPVSILGISRDITARKMAEQALRESEDRYRKLVEIAPDAILVHQEGRIVYINPAGLELLGAAHADQVVGKSVLDFIHTDSLEKVRTNIGKDLKGERTPAEEIRMLRLDGETVTVEGQGVQTLYQGKPAIQVAIRDITERKQTEQALRESEDRLRTIMQSVQTGIVIIDAEKHTILDADRKALAMIGVKKADIIGSVCHRFICPCEQGECPITDLGKGADASERVLITKSGKRIPVLKTVIPATIAGREVLVESVMDITELKSREDRIRILAGLLDLMPASVTVHDTEGRFLYANEKSFEYHGYTAGEFCKINLHELDVPESEHLIEERIRQLKETGNVSFEVQHYRKDRSVIPLQVNARITTWDGSPVILSIATDITERKQAEEQLEESRERFQKIFNDSPLGIAIVGPGFSFRMVNRQFCDMLKYSEDELLTKSFPDITHPDHLTTDVAESRKLSTGERTMYKTEKRYIRKDGSMLWGSLTASPVKDENGSVLYVIALIEDISDRKQAEAKLVTAYREYQSLLDQIQDVYYRSDTKGRLVTASRSLADLLGYHEIEELLGKNIAEEFYYNPGDREKLLDEIDRKGKVTNYEVQLKRRDGSPVTISASSHFWYHPDGTAGGIEGTFRDITEQKRAAQTIAETTRKISLLSSITRHDVANQVSILKGYAKIAMMKEHHPVVADLLAKIDRAGSTIARQIEFTKEYQELGMHAPGWYRIRDLVEQQKTEGVSLSCTCDAEIFADRMIEKVFFNLFDNAARHGEHVTTITIHCERAPDAGLVITVEDNGIGIPPEDKERIFEKGFGKNTGFGLFLVREILAITGITIRETGITGAGARFEISVPKEGVRLTT